jgi:hypothetical protein
MQSGGPPETCRELAERLKVRLQAKGIPIKWDTIRESPPTIRITAQDGGQAGLPGYPAIYDTAFITQYPTAEEARERAGATHDAVAYGRFVIEPQPGGDAELVKEIQKCL